MRGSTFAVPRPPVFITENSRGTLKNREYCESFAQRIFPRLQYSIKSKQTRCIKNSNLRKKVGIAIKSKETSSQFESVRNSYVAIMNQPVANYLLNHVSNACTNKSIL